MALRKAATDVDDEETQTLLNKESTYDWRKTGVRIVPNRRMPPPKTTLAAITFLVLGTYFFVQGAYDYWIRMHNWEKTQGFMLLGIIMFIPGEYVCVHLEKRISLPFF